MENVNYYDGTRYIFGKDTENAVGENLQKYQAKKILIVG